MGTSWVQVREIGTSSVYVVQLDRESQTILWIVCNLGTTLNLVLGPFVTLMNCFEGFKSVLVQKNFLTVTDLKI